MVEFSKSVVEDGILERVVRRDDFSLILSIQYKAILSSKTRHNSLAAMFD